MRGGGPRGCRRQARQHGQRRVAEQARIVEGSDVEIDPLTLLFPFTDDDLNETVKGINDEALFYWKLDNTTYYSIRNKHGDLICWAQWENFSDTPEVTNLRHKKLAVRVYNEALFPGDGPWLLDYKTDKPIPGSRYFARLEETPDLTY